MIINKNTANVAYRCPICGSGVKSPVGIFALTADKLKLKCPCGGSEMTLSLSKDGKVRVEVPCLICSDSHSFTLNSSLFFSKELFILPCRMSSIDICFIGRQEEVEKALALSEKELLEMLKAAGVESLAALHGQAPYFPDAQLYDILNFMIKELESEGKIHCKCRDGKPSCGIELIPGGSALAVYCERCGAKKYFDTGSLSDAQSFLATTQMTLE